MNRSSLRTIGQFTVWLVYLIPIMTLLAMLGNIVENENPVSVYLFDFVGISLMLLGLMLTLIVWVEQILNIGTKD